jgi:hypothetical protein
VTSLPLRGCSAAVITAVITSLGHDATAAVSAPPEWTLEQARQCWQPMVRPVQHVGVPGYQFQTAVMWDGALVFGPLDFRQLKVMQAELAPLGETRMHVSVGFGKPMRMPDRQGTGSLALRRHLEGGRLPIPHVVARDGDLEWDELVFAHLLGRDNADGMEPALDDLLVTHAIFTVRNTGQVRRAAHLWLHFGDTSKVRLGYKCAQQPELAPAIAHRYQPPFGWVGDKVRYVLPAPEKGECRWREGASAPPGTNAAPPNAIEWTAELSPGEEAALRVVIPYGLVDTHRARQLVSLDPRVEIEKVRRFWRKLEAGPGQILTPDPFVNDYLAAVVGQMAQQVAFRGRSGVWMYKTSPNHYEGYWPCNAAKALPTLDLRGLTNINRPVLQSFVAQQTNDVRGMDKGVMGRDEGLKGEGFAQVHGFLGSFGEWTANPVLLSHGLGMWALASHYRITRDRAWLGEGPGSPLQAMLDASDWVSVQRRRTMREIAGKRAEHWGLLPAASAHDWLAGNTIFNDAFCIYGLAEVVRLLREVNHPRAEELARELAGYRACLHDRYAEARDRARRVPLPDGTSLPYVPRMVQELDWAKLDWTYTGYGPLRAGAWGALDPLDELVNQTLAFLEAGMPRGQGAYFSAHHTALTEARGQRPSADVNWADISDPAAERHLQWRHYVEYETMWPIGGPLFLARDDLPRFFEWLFHNLAVVVHPEWRVGVESLDGVPSCAPGDGERWQCIRKMFVHERDGYDGSQQSLWLLQAIPRAWLRPGGRLAVRDMGTTFGGRVTLELEVAPDGGSVNVTVQWRDLAVLPRGIRMRLRSGDGRPLRGATVDGTTVNVMAGDLIELPVTPRGQLRVVGRFD